MGELEKQLTDPNFIADRLKDIISSGERFVLSTIEKHSHGESFDKDETTAQAIIARVNELKQTEPQKQIITSALQYENLVQSVALLVAENNALLLKALKARD